MSTGVGDVINGMRAPGFDIELRQDGGAWHATFYPTGVAHSIGYGPAYEPSPSRCSARPGRR